MRLFTLVHLNCMPHIYRYASLKDGDASEKCIVRRFRFVRTCTYTKLDSLAYYTPRLYGIAYCS
jgi:hypothetical protein